MAWFRRTKDTQIDVPEGNDTWIPCPSCGAHNFKEEWIKSWRVCPQCNYHDRLNSEERIELLIDKDTFKQLNEDLGPGDPLTFSDAKGPYSEKAKSAQKRTGLNESVVTGTGKIHGADVTLAVMDFRFMGGSLGGSTGQKILLAANYSLKHRQPLIVISASGGARMHEGIISLMQMAKTCAGISRLNKEGIPYISILTDPTTGGVSASYAMVGDLNISEPGAMIGFAGRRVIEETIKEKLPDDFQTAEYLQEHGFIDLIVQRAKMKRTLSDVVKCQ